MELTKDHAALLFAVLMIGFGVYGFVKGELQVGPEGGDSSDDKTVTGSSAKFLSGALIIAGVTFPFSATWGVVIAFGAALIAYFVSD